MTTELTAGLIACAAQCLYLALRRDLPTRGFLVGVAAVDAVGAIVVWLAGS